VTSDDAMRDAAELNDQMISRTKASGAIRSSAVEAAFRGTPRHLFLPGVGLDLVYSGNAIVTRSDPECGITSSSSEVAVMGPMLETLQLEPGSRVLEIGAGTGYNAALLHHLVGSSGEVTSIDNQPAVVDDAREHLQIAGHNQVRLLAGDGHAGVAAGAPFDRIIATASVRDIPIAWRDQLRDGGVLVVPLRFGPGAQFVATFARRSDRLTSVRAVPGGFMPLRTDGETLETPLRVAPDFDVQIASAQEGDAEILAELLATEPAISVSGTYAGQVLFSIAGLVERDWITIRPRLRNGSWQGVFDRTARGVAFVWPIVLPSGVSRTSVLVHGSTAAGERLRSVLDQLADVSLDRVTLDAVPRDQGRPSADVVYERPNFWYAVSWHAARASSSPAR